MPYWLAVLRQTRTLGAQTGPKRIPNLGFQPRALCTRHPCGPSLLHIVLNTTAQQQAKKWRVLRKLVPGLAFTRSRQPWATPGPADPTSYSFQSPCPVARLPPSSDRSGSIFHPSSCEFPDPCRPIATTKHCWEKHTLLSSALKPRPCIKILGSPETVAPASASDNGLESLKHKLRSFWLFF